MVCITVHPGCPAWLSPFGGPLMGPGSANNIHGIICVCVFFLPLAFTIIQLTITSTIMSSLFSQLKKLTKAAKQGLYFRQVLVENIAQHNFPNILLQGRKTCYQCSSQALVGATSSIGHMHTDKYITKHI